MLVFYQLFFEKAENLKTYPAQLNEPKLFKMEDGLKIGVQETEQFTRQIPSNLTENEKPNDPLLVIQFATFGISDSSKKLHIYVVVSQDWLEHNILENIGIDRETFIHFLSHNLEGLSLEKPFDYHVRQFMPYLAKTFLQTVFVKQWAYQFLNDFFLNIVLSINKPTKNISLKDSRKIVQLEQSITLRLNQHCPSVREMAGEVGMSISKFKSVFDAIYGESPHQYFINQRVMMAKSLLQTGEFSITEVAQKVGFTHPSMLTRLFSNSVNTLPSSFIPKAIQEERYLNT